MKEIKIAHLYYDLMNLYGENGNTRVLVKAFEDQGVKASVYFLSLEDKIEFDKYDIFYIGTGSEENQLLVNANLLKYKDNIKKCIDNNKYFIVTGNALELFGKHIELLDGNKLNTLGIFDYYCKETDFRIIGEQVYTTTLFDKKVIGFQNRSTTMFNCNSNLFNVITGTGYVPKNNYEGIKYNNFIGTYLLGPLLVRNPYLLKFIVKDILKDEYKDIDDEYMLIAYNEYIKNFID